MTILTDTRVVDVAVQRLQSVQPDAERLWGRMSVGGMLCHVNDAYAGTLRLRLAAATGGGGSLTGRWLMRPFALHVPLRWPQGIPTPPGVDQLVGGTPPGGFADDKDRLIHSLRQFAAAEMGGVAHPIFGPLTQWEWMRWGWLHADHHLRQFSS